MNIKDQLSVVYEIEAILKLLNGDEADLQKRSMLDRKVDMLLQQLYKGRSEASSDAALASDTVLSDQVNNANPENAVVQSAADPLDGQDEFIVETGGGSVTDGGQVTVVIEDVLADHGSVAEQIRHVDLNDETLRRKASVGLKNVFTLNDRFRFRRELFGNSDALFYGTIDQVEKMATIAEAEQYFYGGLSWDPSDPDVKDFMRIVLAYLKN